MATIRQDTLWWQRSKRELTDLGTLIKYFDTCNRSDGKSKDTIRWYNQTLKQFEEFLAETGRPTSIEDLGEPEVREYIIYLQGRCRWPDNPHVSLNNKPLSAISIQTYVRALRAFFKWLWNEGYTENNRLASLKPPKAPDKLVQILTPQEISDIFRSINTSTPVGARNYSMLMLFLDSGLRCSELRRFSLDDINFDGRYLKVMGKGGKERVVPFGLSTEKALLRYSLRFRPEPFNPTFRYFFLTHDGKPLSKNCVYLIIRRIAAKSGVTRLHPHLCRHTFATNYLINGGDVFSLQQILGHTTLEMVKRYITLASSHVTAQHRKYSPMDRLQL
jgi:site-specific recombinase XerD